MTTAKGGRPASGQIKWMRNKKTGKPCWHARYTIDGRRTPFGALDPRIPEEDRARAEQCAIDSRERLIAGGAVFEDVGESVSEWFKRFHAHKEAKGFSTVGDMRGRAKKWILPDVAGKDMRAVNRDDIEAIVQRLDRAVAAFQSDGPGKGRLSPSTAANVWGDVVHAFDEAVKSKNPGLRVLSVSPCANVPGPDAGDERHGQILYSDEVLALVRGVPADPEGWPVPVYRRQCYAMAVYTKTRSSELEAIKPEDVDLAHQTITISKQADRKSKKRTATKKTKTKRTRTIDIEPNLLPLVEWLVKHPQGRGGRLVHMPPPEDRAELLRKDLRTVGATRAALHVEGDPSERAVTFHDLRDTGLTHMAVRGDSPIVIQWAGGHTDFKTTQGYIERGQTERRRIGEPLPPLPSDLLTPIDRFRKVSDSSQTGAGNDPESFNFLRPQRELNPCYRRERPVS